MPTILTDSSGRMKSAPGKRANANQGLDTSNLYGGHTMSSSQTTLSDRDVARFWSKVSGASYTWCWIWTGTPNADGYGVFRLDGRNRQAHRVAYGLLIADIPDGLELDHLCRRRDCVNPWHLEPVTTEENIRRGRAGEAAGERNATKTHCPKGHPYTKANTYIQAKGSRACRACHRESRPSTQPPSRRLLSKGKMIEVRRRLAAGASQQQVAELLGVSQQTISKSLKRGA